MYIPADRTYLEENRYEIQMQNLYPFMRYKMKKKKKEWCEKFGKLQLQEENSYD